MDDSALRQRYALALAAGRMGTFELDVATGAVVWDDALEQLMEALPGEHPHRLEDFAQRVHHEDLPAVLERVRACAAGELAEYRHEYRIIGLDGSIMWVRSHVVPHTGGDARLRLVGVVVDITEEHQTREAIAAARAAEREAREAADVSQRRLELLAHVSSLLNTPPDVSGTLQRVAELAIDLLADWCVVDLEDDEGGQGRQRVAIAHRDPQLLQLAEEVERRWPPRADDPVRAAVLATGEPVVYPHIDDQLMVAAAHSQEHLDALRRFVMTSGARVAVQAGGRALGVLTLIGTHGRRISQEDVELAVELGRQAGAAVERTRLQAQRDRLTTALQRALLPPALPAIPGVDIAAAYEPAGAGNEVGGDFYDVLSTGENRWWLAVGDVQGKGPEAAALTGRIRPVLAAILHETDDPAQALAKTEAALGHLGLQQRTVSLLLATFEAGPDPLEIRIATAGHPPPLLRTPASSAPTAAVRTIPAEGVLLGVGAPMRPHTQVVRLGTGDLLVCYTDGVTDAPLADGTRLGEARLQDLVAAAPGKPSALVDAIIDALRRNIAGRRDDIALLAFGPTPN